MSRLTAEMEKRLTQVHGQIIPAEGLILAELAAEVPNSQVIVEIGAYKGKSSCYLAAGARAGLGALVYSVDLWENGPWPEYARPEIPGNWRDNIGHLGLVEQKGYHRPGPQCSVHLRHCSPWPDQLDLGYSFQKNYRNHL